MPGRKLSRRRSQALIEIHHPPATRQPIDRKKYGGKWVAIRYRRIIDSDEDFDALCDRMEAKGIEEKVTFLHVLEPGLWIL
jgi:hypothetical protein